MDQLPPRPSASWRTAARRASAWGACLLLGIPLAACTAEPSPTPTEPTETAAPSSPAAAPSTGASGSSTPDPAASSSPGALIPTVELVTDLSGVATGSGSAAVVPRTALVTLLSERLSDADPQAVQTVVCGADVPLRAGASTTCTATLTDNAQAGDETWYAYPAHRADGKDALLLLHGDPLSPEFAKILAAPGTTMTTGSVDPAFGSATSSGAEVLKKAQHMLSAAKARTTLTRCTGTVAFETFEPVTCEGTRDGKPIRGIVLPGSFLTDEPGLVVVIQPAS